MYVMTVFGNTGGKKKTPGGEGGGVFLSLVKKIQKWDAVRKCMNKTKKKEGGQESRTSKRLLG